MNSKAKILERIARDGMPEYPYPQFDFTPQRFDDRAATDEIAKGGTSTSHFLTPKSVLAVKASTGAYGLVELATETETTAGTDAERAVTPKGVKAALDATIKDATETEFSLS